MNGTDNARFEMSGSTWSNQTVEVDSRSLRRSLHRPQNQQYNVLTRQGWTDYNYYVGSSLDNRSTSKGGLVGGNATEEGKTSMVHYNSKPADLFDTHYSSGRSKKPRIFLYTLRWRRAHTARCRTNYWYFGKHFQRPSHCTTPWPQICLVPVARRTKHDTRCLSQGYTFLCGSFGD